MWAEAQKIPDLYKVPSWTAFFSCSKLRCRCKTIQWIDDAALLRWMGGLIMASLVKVTERNGQRFCHLTPVAPHFAAVSVYRPWVLWFLKGTVWGLWHPGQPQGPAAAVWGPGCKCCPRSHPEEAAPCLGTGASRNGELWAASSWTVYSGLLGPRAGSL